MNDPFEFEQVKLWVPGRFLGLCENGRKIEPMNNTKDGISSPKRKRRMKHSKVIT
jgi:hypothetical protein